MGDVRRSDGGKDKREAGVTHPLSQVSLEIIFGFLKRLEMLDTWGSAEKK